MFRLTTKLEGGDEARKRAERLFAVMGLKNKRRYNYYLGRQVGKTARQHVKLQQGVDGRPWAKRKRMPRRKVLTRIARRNRLWITSDAEAATVTYKNRQTGIRARIHHEGGSERVNATRAVEATGKVKGSAPAAKAQIRALRKLGVNVAELEAQRGGLTWQRAGLILHRMRRRGKPAVARHRRSSWTITYPERSFLGLSDAESIEAGRDVFSQLLKDVETGRV